MPNPTVCRAHPDYKGTRKPKSCPACFRVWHEAEEARLKAGTGVLFAENVEGVNRAR